MKLKIDSEFQLLIPPLNEEERMQLEKNIVAEGCRDALVTWQGIIIDGHNRYEICTRLGIDFRTTEYTFASRDDVRMWMVQNQMGRRNLNDFLRVRLQLIVKPFLVEKARANMSAGDVHTASGVRGDDGAFINQG